MKRIKMSLAALAICGLLFANLDVKGYDGAKLVELNPPVACFDMYTQGGNQVFNFCNGCEKVNGSEPEMSGTCS